MPAAMASCTGFLNASGSAKATAIASGLVRIAVSIMSTSLAASKVGGPRNWASQPSCCATAFMPAATGMKKSFVTGVRNTMRGLGSAAWPAAVTASAAMTSALWAQRRRLPKQLGVRLIISPPLEFQVVPVPVDTVRSSGRHVAHRGLHVVGRERHEMHTAVDVELNAVDVAGLVGRQEQRRIGNVPGRSHPGAGKHGKTFAQIRR